MRIRCNLCGHKQNYNPRDRMLLGRKRCEDCNRYFRVSESDIILEDRESIARDRNAALIKSITDWMQNGHQRTTWTELKSVFNLSPARTSRIIKKLIYYEIALRQQKNICLYKPYIADSIETSSDLPEFAEWHFIKIRCEILHRENFDSILTKLNRNNIQHTIADMNGNWRKLFVYSELDSWGCIEINEKTVFLNYRGVIRTNNPVASVENIESHDLLSAIVFLNRIGITIKDRITDANGHWALLGQKLTREEINIYEQIWSDESTGAPEIETDSLEIAQQLIDKVKTVKKCEDYLKFRFFSRERHVFFKLKEQFKRKQLSFMQFIEHVQQLTTFQLFAAVPAIRRRVLQQQVIRR